MYQSASFMWNRYTGVESGAVGHPGLVSRKVVNSKEGALVGQNVSAPELISRKVRYIQERLPQIINRVCGAYSVEYADVANFKDPVASRLKIGGV